MTDHTDLSIIIVTYNSEKNIGGLLDSIKKSPDKLSKEVIVVDNASQDKTLKVITKHRLKTRLIKSKQNLGFAKAVNLAIKQAHGENYLLLNPDTVLVGKVLEVLFQFAQKTRPLGAVAPRLLNFNGKPQASVFYFPSLTNAVLRYFFGFKNRFSKYLPSKSQPVQVAIMAALFIPKATIDKVGLLDERFFMYYEDIEFAKRLRQFHLPLYYLTSAKIKHVSGASGNFKSHLESPLLKSAQIYHGRVYSKILNLTLWLGQKFEKLLRRD